MYEVHPFVFFPFRLSQLWEHTSRPVPWKESLRLPASQVRAHQTVPLYELRRSPLPLSPIQCFHERHPYCAQI